MVSLHRFAVFLAGATVILLVAGGLVTSTGSGLSVPDWPTTYGWSMFTFPLSKMVGGIYYEHGHRLIASTVGFLTIILAIWLWRCEPRRWVRRLGVLALVAVCVQGALGGITVRYFLPAPVSIAHAGLAQIFFCLTVALALVTSRAWMTPTPGRPVDDHDLRRLSVLMTTIIYVQIILGAAMRHTGAGLAIPDFPLSFGHVVPPDWTEAIAIHFAHRVGALVVTISVLTTALYVWRVHRSRVELRRPALLAVAVVSAQVTLGALTVLSGKAVAINTAHVVTGALLLATSLVLTLRAFRVKFSIEPAPPMTGRSADPLFAARPSIGARA